MITLLENCATITDFIDLYGEVEATEISNLCDPDATTVNTVKLQAMLDNAEAMVNGKYVIAPDCGRALIKISCKQLVLWIARYLGDSTKSRPFVDEDYKRAMEYMEYACKECGDNCPLSQEEVEAIVGTSTQTKLRCCSGNGNRYSRLVQPAKVDYREYDSFKVLNFDPCADIDVKRPY